MNDSFVTLGKYRLIEQIGAGTFGWVYRATDPIGRTVAVKVLKPGWADDPGITERFRREVQVAGQLFHTRIATIIDFDEADGRRFLVMRYVDGLSLDKLIKEKGRLSWSESLEILGQVAEGLDYAHSRGFIHRDIKPANILVSKTEGAVLTDFGLARISAGNGLSGSSAIIGTPHYIAPEIWNEETTGQTADIYSLACVAAEMLSGQILFNASSVFKAMKQHVEIPAPLPEHWPGDIPPGLNAVLAHALEKDPQKRTPSAAEFVRELKKLKPAVTPITHPDQATTAAIQNMPQVNPLRENENPARANFEKDQARQIEELTARVERAEKVAQQATADKQQNPAGSRPQNWWWGLGLLVLLALAAWRIFSPPPATAAVPPSTLEPTAAAFSPAPTAVEPTPLPNTELPPPQVTNLVLWDFAHDNDHVPAQFTGGTPWENDTSNLYDYIQKLGFEQRIIKSPEIETLITTMSGKILDKNKVRVSFDLPAGLEYVVVHISPTYFNSTDGDTRVWIWGTLLDPAGSEPDPANIAMVNDCIRERCERKYILVQPQAGNWSMDLGVSVEKNSTPGTEVPVQNPIDYSITVGTTSPSIKATTLAGAKAVFLIDPGTHYFPSELDELTRFVENGGSLLIVEVPYYKGYDGDVTNTVTERFGFNSYSDSGGNSFSNAEYSFDRPWPLGGILDFSPLGDPLTNGLTKFVCFRSGNFYSDQGKAIPLLQVEKGGVLGNLGEKLDASPLIAALAGSGKVIASGDPCFINLSAGTRTISDHVIDFDQYDNAALTRNIMEWLLK